MYRFFIEAGQICDKVLHISGEDVNHIRNVLRMRPGEEIEAVDEDRSVSICRISQILQDEILAEVLETREADTELQNEITLYMGLPKGDKMELIIQKAVELGVSRIVPVSMKRSIVKLDAKKAKARVVRWQAIAQAAAKQSKRSIIPEVGEIESFSGALEEAKTLDALLVPYENAMDIRFTKNAVREIRPGQSVGVLIGLTLITAGAFGNIIDSLFYGLIWDYAPFMFGKVVDMFYFPIIRSGEKVIFFSPVFNFADSCVTVGAFYLILFQWKFFAKDEKKEPQE